MKHRLSASQEKQTSETQEQQQLNQASTRKEFNSVDDMLRLDASQTPVPDRIGQRLQASLGELEPPKSWWRRWLGL
jgi:hypothetical protein